MWKYLRRVDLPTVNHIWLWKKTKYGIQSIWKLFWQDSVFFYKFELRFLAEFVQICICQLENCTLGQKISKNLVIYESKWLFLVLLSTKYIALYNTNNPFLHFINVFSYTKCNECGFSTKFDQIITIFQDYWLILI